jgi:VanZ family protein
VIGRWLPVAAYMAALYYGALMPSVPGAVGSVSDTLLHAGGYAVLAVLALRATAGGRWRGLTPLATAAAFAIAVAHGVTVELLQLLVPSRFAEWRDLWNNAIGAAGGLAAVWAWGIMKRDVA